MNKDSRILLLENEENKGILYSFTKAILNSKGKYIKILNLDDLLSFEKFSFNYVCKN